MKFDQIMPSSNDKRWVFTSSVESADARKTSAASILETIIIASLYFYTTKDENSSIFVFSILIAPLLLLRSENSISYGIILYKRFMNLYAPFERNLSKKEISSIINPFMFGAYSFIPVAILNLILLIILWIILRFFVPIVVTFMIKFYSTLRSFIQIPLITITGIPRNWWLYIGCIDIFHVPELLPGTNSKRYVPSDQSLYKSYIEEAVRSRDTIQKSTDIFLEPFRHRHVNNAFFVLSILESIFKLSSSFFLLFVVWSPAIFYRWSLKGTCVVYCPLIWIVHIAKSDTVFDRLREVKELYFYRIQLGFSLIVLFFVISRGLITSWLLNIEGDSFVQQYRDFAIAIIGLEEIPIWEISAGINSILAWVIFLFADTVIHRYDRTLISDSATIRYIYATLNVVRTTLTIYSIVIILYTVVSTLQDIDLPPVGTDFLPPGLFNLITNFLAEFFS